MENLSFICGGLGEMEEDDDNSPIYVPGEYCLDNLKDLLRFLRRDDPETREVFKQVCKWNIVGKDILQIIQFCQNDTTLVLNAVKVLVFLTMPVDPTSKDIPQQIEYLWDLKSLITFSHVIPVIVTLLESPLEHLEGELFTDDDWKLVQLVVTLFRNMLAIQDITTQQRAAGSASELILLRDRFLQLLFDENVMDLILVLTQHVGGSNGVFRQDNLLLLETFYYTFKGQVPELVARAHLDANVKVVGETEATATDLKSIMEEEKAKRRQTILCNIGARSKFSGSFTRRTMDGSKVLVKGNPCSGSHDSSLKAHKNQHGASKKMVWESGRMPTTNKNILRLLCDYTDQFLLGGYNVLMRSVREDIEKEHHGIENNDVVTFFQVAEFVMSFQNHKLLSSKSDAEVSKSETSRNHDSDSTLFKGNICGSISETMNELMFLLVISKWRSAFEGLKETNNYSFLSAAGSLTKTMIRMLDLVLKMSPEDSKEPQTARVLLYKLFYDQTDQGMTYFLFSLIKAFNAHKQPKSDLADLVETIHVVIRLMENLQSRGTLRVAKKSRRKRKKKAINTSEDANNADQVTVQNEDLVSGGEKPENVSMPVKEMEMPQGSSVDKNEEGDDVIVGDDDVIPRESDQPDAANLETQDAECNVPQMEDMSGNANSTANANVNANEDYVTDDSSDDEHQESTNEVDFKASSLVSSIANSTIIQNLCWLLKFYKSNSIRTNHYIISALRRVCEDLELSPMLYQLSLLIIFHTILEEQRLSPCKEHDNIVLFLTSLVKGMLKKMKSYPLLFVEVLFWKTRKECHYISCESMIKDLGKMRSGYNNKKGDDSLHADHGEVGTSGRNEWVRKSIADALGDDEADVVVPVWKEDDKSEEDPEEALVQRTSKRSNRNVGEGEETNGEELNNEHPVQQNHVRARKRLKPLVLDDALEQKLKDLYEKYKELPDSSQRIVAELNMEVSPAQVSSKLKEMGLKLPSKRRMSDTNVTNTREAMDISPQRPKTVRKRIRGLSEDQEAKIKTLFEQFKGKKKCSQMIASALDGDVTFTAAQMSRKLRQLGLRIRKQKTADNIHLRDEDDTSNSDGETLLSLKKRSKKKHNIIPTEETPDENVDQLSDDSADIVLSSAFSKKKRKNKVPTKETPDKIADQLSDDSDNIVLSSAFSKKKQNNRVSTKETLDQLSDDSDNIVLSSAFSRGSKRLSLTKAQGSLGNSHNNSPELETEVIETGSGQEENVTMTENTDNMQDDDDDELRDDLADIGDNSSPIESQKAGGGARRKLRMIIDPDDED